MKNKLIYIALVIFSMMFSSSVAVSPDYISDKGYESTIAVDDDDKKITVDAFDSDGEVTSTITVEKKVYYSNELIMNIKSQMGVSECHVQGDCLICYEPKYVCIPLRSECNCGE